MQFCILHDIYVLQKEKERKVRHINVLINRRWIIVFIRKYSSPVHSPLNEKIEDDIHTSGLTKWVERIYKEIRSFAFYLYVQPFDGRTKSA